MKAKPPEEALHDQCLNYMGKFMFKEPRQRHDVIHRKVLNLSFTPTIVKTTWNSFCHPAASLLSVDAVLFEVNKAITEAYLLANVHVLRLCDANIALPPLNQTFFYQCLSAVSLTDKNKTEPKSLDFRESVALFNSWHPSTYTPPNSKHLASGWFQQASQQMATACKNSTSMNFYSRFKRFLKLKHQMDGKAAYEALKAIQATDYSGSDPLVLQYRQLMPTKPKYGRVEDCPELVMPLQHLFLTFFETHHATADIPKAARLFTLIPTKQSFTCNHLKMCTNGLYGLLKKSGVTGLPSEGTAFREVADTYWRRFFRVSEFETSNRKFAGEVLLDGKGVSIVLRKPRHTDIMANQKAVDSNAERWGLDPGRRDMFVATNHDGQVQRCSTRQFYHEAGYKFSLQKTRMWQEQNEAVKEAIHNMPSKKTSQMGKLQIHVSFLATKLDMLLRFHMQKGFRDLKFKRYVLAQKKLLKISKALTKASGRATTVGFGDWSNKDDAGIIKRSPAGPVKRLGRQLQHHCRVIPVDEFRSSKLCCRCHCPLENMRAERECRDGMTRRVKIHSVLFCRNKSCHGMTVNRDVNASRNILQLLEAGPDRPVAFQRACTALHPSWGLQSSR